MLRKSYILGVGITNETEDKILEYLLLSLKQPTTKYYIVTPNPEILVYAHNHPGYKKILNVAIALPDGVGVFLGCALMGHALRERITGVDFMEEVCRRSAEQPLRMGFLGGRGGVAEKTAECLKAKYPWIEVGFVGEEWSNGGFQDPDAGPVSPFPRPTASLPPKGTSFSEAAASLSPGARRGSPALATRSKETLIDILFVAFGHPKQEEWIYENLEHLPVKVAMGVGGAFDYISGRVVRAPFMIRAIGLEWLFRLIREPWRWRRQMALGKFVWLVVKERLGGKGDE
jgi:N-acetylglucosaminyldiphosphoundecaprenol N-acetyl-beta-D-mannosaminyltransferase